MRRNTRLASAITIKPIIIPSQRPRSWGVVCAKSSRAASCEANTLSLLDNSPGERMAYVGSQQRLETIKETLSIFKTLSRQKHENLRKMSRCRSKSEKNVSHSYSQFGVDLNQLAAGHKLAAGGQFDRLLGVSGEF
jgi:hypothetical protein